MRKWNLVSEKGKEENNVYDMYYEFSEKISKLQHRILAINRGEKGALKVSISYDKYRWNLALLYVWMMKISVINLKKLLLIYIIEFLFPQIETKSKFEGKSRYYTYWKF